MEDVKLQEKIKAFLSVDDGYGSGYGSGSGYGYGSGSGFGDGDGYGYGSGYGYGDGDGIEEFNGKHVHRIDDVQTIITSVHGNVAKGFILQSDLSLTPCYVVKGNNLFAHGEDLHQAMAALTDKMFDDMPEEERIAEFIKAHPDKKALYTHKDLYDWHHRLTGSCVAGRNAFARDHGIDMEGSSTVEYFIELTRNAYGGSIIRKLEEAYKA